MNHRAFTVIELLATVVVVTLLAAILVPVVNHLQGAGESARCQANLRQIGVAFQLYRQENNGAFPPSATDAGPYFTWYQFLLGHGPGAEYDSQTRTFVDGSAGPNYLGDRGLLNCPSGSYAHMGTSTQWPLGYGMGNFLLWNPPPSHRTDSLADTFFSWRLKKPSQWPLVMCADRQRIWQLDNPQAGTDSGNRFAARHGGFANVLMVDGHIERAKYGDQSWSQGNLNRNDLYSY